MQAFRAALLRFADDGSAVYDADGFLLVGPRRRRPPGGARGRCLAGAEGQLSRRGGQHLPGRMLAPGFIDLHVHFPQTDVIGSPAEGLLPWLENYTFPHEARFADPAYADGVATVFLDELLRHGVTTPLTFAPRIRHRSMR
jgi:guanine deaminase